jgi:AcrR family transcriptional regulator
MATARAAAAAVPKQARAHATRQKLLDAAVEELVEHGYTGLTTSGVARRAGVSRGAAQNYFPHKATLVAEAVRHLGERQCEELQARVGEVPGGQARVQRGLDVLFEQYSGPLFAAVIELTLAARGDDELGEVTATQERNVAEAMHEAAGAIFGEDFPSTAEDRRRWATVLSAIRGLALLKLLGHAPEAVDRQWASTRRQLLALLT